MAEVIRSAPPDPFASNVVFFAGSVRPSAAEDLSGRLRRRWEELKQRTSYPTAAGRPSLIRELRDDAKYVRLRVRSYHENRPLHAAVMIAAAAFVLGLLMGLVRK